MPSSKRLKVKGDELQRSSDADLLQDALTFISYSRHYLVQADRYLGEIQRRSQVK